VDNSRVLDTRDTTYEFTPEGDLAPRSSHWAQWLLFFGFFVSLLVGLVALAGLYWLESSQAVEPIARPPHGYLVPAGIPPHLALEQLAGAPEAPLVQQAINASQVDLAFATLSFDTRLASSQRSGLLLLMGRRFQQGGHREGAAQAYRLARTIGVLAPDLTALERGQVLVQSAEGLLLAGDVDSAFEAAVQAMLVAAQSPGLLPAQRSQILASLGPIFGRQDLHPAGLDVALASQRLADLQRGPNLSPEGEDLFFAWDTLSEPPDPEPILLDAVLVRQAAARRLADRMIMTGGLDVEPEREALAAALLAEDRLRVESYQRQQAAGPALARQHWIAQERRAWLALKLRVALGGFGARLVPDWEAAPEVIVDDLRIATEELVTVLAAQVNAQTDPLARAMLQVAALRWLALQSELGFYPDAPVADLGEQLLVMQRDLATRGSPPALPILYEPESVTELKFHFAEELP
jgi:hypothetical protein